MTLYKIDERYIEAPDEETAKLLIESLKDVTTPAIIIMRGGVIYDVIQITSKTGLYFFDKKSVSYAGELLPENTGSRILQSMYQRVKHEQKSLIAAIEKKKKFNRESKHKLEEKHIKDFESTIPESVRHLYDYIMKAIDCLRMGYKLELYSEIADIKIKPEQWFPVLFWFKERVLKAEEEKELKDRSDFYKLRAAFVTTVRSMITNGVRQGNAMRLVKVDKTKDFDWIKYVDDKNKSRS